MKRTTIYCGLAILLISQSFKPLGGNDLKIINPNVAFNEGIATLKARITVLHYKAENVNVKVDLPKDAEIIQIGVNPGNGVQVNRTNDCCTITFKTPILNKDKSFEFKILVANYKSKNFKIFASQKNKQIDANNQNNSWSGF